VPAVRHNPKSTRWGAIIDALASFAMAKIYGY
jgi:hypothetical protein